MPDFDIRKALNNGIKGIFIEVILVSISIFIAFQWQKYTSEVIEVFSPQGRNLIEKFIINVIITLIMIGLAYILLKTEKKSN